MIYRVKGWKKFQHFKDRKPPWIKLYRDLLNDREWFLLEPEAAKFLVFCWMIAAEYDGNLPDIETLAFRYRVASKEIVKLLSLCKHWIVQDDSIVLSDCYQLAIPELETETEKKEKNICSKQVRTSDPEGFLDFYSRYPRKTGRGKAVLAWQRAVKKTTVEAIINGLAGFKFSDDKQFIPEPSAWLNAERWADETTPIAEPKITKNKWGKGPHEMNPQELEEFLAEQRKALQ